MLYSESLIQQSTQHINSTRHQPKMTTFRSQSQDTDPFITSSPPQPPQRRRRVAESHQELPLLPSSQLSHPPTGIYHRSPRKHASSDAPSSSQRTRVPHSNLRRL